MIPKKYFPPKKFPICRFLNFIIPFLFFLEIFSPYFYFLIPVFYFLDFYALTSETCVRNVYAFFFFFYDILIIFNSIFLTFDDSTVQRFVGFSCSKNDISSLKNDAIRYTEGLSRRDASSRTHSK